VAFFEKYPRQDYELKAWRRHVAELPERTDVEDVEAAETPGIAIPDGKFGTIYADPPWPYENQSTRAATSDHYKTLTLDQICEFKINDIPIKDLAAPESHLHLWTTNAFLFEAKRVLEAWGFEYKGAFVWVKPQMGIGNYWRVSHEFLLLGVKGGLTFENHSAMSWMRHDRLEHSEKPDAIRLLIEEVSPSPRLELFGRKRVEGWTVCGDEIPALVETRL
jgi:N6-adenosine-specific RNA methylase IME4